MIELKTEICCLIFILFIGKIQKVKQIMSLGGKIGKKFAKKIMNLNFFQDHQFQVKQDHDTKI